MKKVALWILIVSVMISGAALGADSSQMDAAATMAISEKNGDNRIDRGEYHERMTEVFFFMDTDKDGQLTISELRAVEEVDPQRFAAADRDGNHSLSLYEFLNALNKDFEAADKNSDGTLDMEELHLMVGK
jgi:Ca2+-binding EF-hand superfamily protein